VTVPMVAPQVTFVGVEEGVLTVRWAALDMDYARGDVTSYKVLYRAVDTTDEPMEEIVDGHETECSIEGGSPS
jgi:hypothetical protein